MQQHGHPATWLSEEPDADYDPPEDLVRLLADSECGKYDASRMHQCAVGFQPGTMHVQMAKRARTSISADSGEHSSGHSTANVAGPEQTFSYPGENAFDSVAGIQHAELSHDQAGCRAGAHGARALFAAATLAVQPQEQQQRSQTNKCRPDVLRIQLQMLIEQVRYNWLEPHVQRALLMCPVALIAPLLMPHSRLVLFETQALLVLMPIIMAGVCRRSVRSASWHLSKAALTAAAHLPARQQAPLPCLHQMSWMQ